MSLPIQLDVDDSSPEVVYSPFRDTFATPDTLHGWNPYYSISGFAQSFAQIGNGTSFHITSLDGATLALQWHGTAIQLLGNATQASYSITLDGHPTPPNSSVPDNVLASYTDLPDTNHTLSLSVQIPGTPSTNSFLAFDKAVISASDAVNQTSSFQDMNDANIAFLGDWTFQQINDTAGQHFAFHQSTTTGDRAFTSFYGTTFVLLGTISPSSSTYSVTLNSTSQSGQTSSVTATLSARSSFTQYNSSLFIATGLNATELTSLEVLNVDGGLLQLDAGGFTIAGSPFNSSANSAPVPSAAPSHPSSYSAGTLAALALAGILLFFIISLIMFYLFYWRTRSQRHRSERMASLRRRQEEEEIGQVLDIRPAANSTHSSWRRRLRLNFGHEKDVPDPSPVSPRGSPRANGADPVASGQQQRRPPSAIIDLPLVPTFPPPTRFRGTPLDAAKQRSLHSQSGHTPSDVYFSTAGALDISDFDVDPGLQRQRQQQRTTPLQPRTIPRRRPPSYPSQRMSSARGGGKRSGSTQFLMLEGTPHPGSPVLSAGGDEDEDELEYIDAIGEGVRQLSPRTSEVVILGGGRLTTRSGPSEMTISDVGPDPRFPADVGAEGEGDGDDEDDGSEEGGRNAAGGDSFLSVRETSPFRVEFPQRSRRGSRLIRLSGQSRVRFQDEEESAAAAATAAADEATGGDSAQVTDPPPPPLPQPSQPAQPPQPQPPQAAEPPLPILRLAPPTNGNGNGPVGDRKAVVSFLELSGSSTSGSTKSSSGDSRPPERSRWSSTTAQSVATTAAPSMGNTTTFSLGSDSRPSTAPRSSFATFPFAVVGPGGDTTQLQLFSGSGSSSGNGRAYQPSHMPTHAHHPFSDPSASIMTSASSTDSVPMSVSDIRFRHSESDDGANPGSRRTSTGSRLPPHPPLPSPLQAQYQHHQNLNLNQDQSDDNQNHDQNQGQNQNQSQSQGLGHNHHQLFFGSPDIVERVLGLRNQPGSGGDSSRPHAR